MIQRTVSVVACLLAVTLIGQQTATASSRPEKEVQLAGKVKAGIQKLGVGHSAHVNLKLKDRSKFAGYISEIGDDSFVVTDPNNSQPTTIPYSNVAQVKGNNLSTGAKIAIYGGIVAAVIIVLIIVKGAFCDGC